METNPGPLPPPGAAMPIPPARLNWRPFFAAMILARLSTSGRILPGAKQGDTAPAQAALGGGLSGILCGMMLGRRFGRTLRLKIVLGIVSLFIMGVACFTMNCFGCIARGYKLPFN